MKRSAKIGLIVGMSVLGAISVAIIFFAVFAPERLNAPVSLAVDADNSMLSWTVISDAKSYNIVVTKIDGSESDAIKKTSTRPNITFVKLGLYDEGDYNVRIQAVGDGKKFSDSEWSKEFSFVKYYESGCVYTLINNGTEYAVSSMGVASGDVVIEDNYRGKPVTRIGDAAFKNRGSLKSVTLGNGIKEIGDNAFYNCYNLETAVLPDSLKEMGEAVFQSCSKLKEIKIPTGITQIKQDSFSYCRSLSLLEIGNKVTYIGPYAFYECSALDELVIPDSVTHIDENAFFGNRNVTSLTLGTGLEKIGAYAFYNNYKLNGISFPADSSLVSIGNYAFSNAFSPEKSPEGEEEIAASAVTLNFPYGLEEIGYACFEGAASVASVTIPDSVNHVGGRAFYGTALYNAQEEAEEGFLFADKWLVDCSEEVKKTLVTFNAAAVKKDDLFGIADYAFCTITDRIITGPEKLKTVEFPSTLKYVGNYAFAASKELSRLGSSASGANLKKIGDSAFRECSALSRLVLNEGLEEIGGYAFYGCILLDNSSFDGGSGIIPSTVTSIGTYAFRNTKLWRTPDDNGIVYAGNWAVGYSGNVSGDISLRADTRGISDYAFYNCSALRSITGLAGVRYIGRAAFYNCASLSVARFNENIREIKDYTFYNCSSLGSVTLPDNLEKIGRSAFYKCSKLLSVNMADTMLVSIGDYAFYNCESLSGIVFGNRVETIGAYAFYKNSATETIALPDSLISIGTRAFARNEALRAVDFGNGVREIGEGAFLRSGLTDITLPDSLLSVGAMAFYRCSEAERLSVGNGIEYVGDYAFYGLTSVTYLNLPESVKNIGGYAFKGIGAASVILKSTTQETGAHIFYGNADITIYTDAVEAAPDWHIRFNSAYIPVVWGVTLSQDGSYVESVTVTENTFQTLFRGEISDPVREDKAFLYWATEDDGSGTQYSSAELKNIPLGVKVYTVWGELPDEGGEETDGNDPAE